MDANKLKCSRTVSRENLEKSKNSEFYKFIKEVTAIPPEKQPEILRKVLPKHILGTVFRILNVKDKQIISSRVPRQISTHEIPQKIENETTDVQSVGRVNPYLKFHNGENVDIWNRREYEDECRPIFEAIYLEMEKIITEFLAKNKPRRGNSLFASRCRLLLAACMKAKDAVKGSDFMSVKSFKDLFEVHPTFDSATSLKVSLKELPAVPTYVALVRKCPEKMISNCLKKIINLDLCTLHEPAKVVAFSQCLPKDLRTFPNPDYENPIGFTPNDYQTEIMTMENVVKNVGNMTIYKKYVQFLNKKPFQKWKMDAHEYNLFKAHLLTLEYKWED